MNLICFCHLRWNFVYQRPQHLLSRFAKKFSVYFIEEPVFDSSSPVLETQITREGISVIVPHLPQGLGETEILKLQKDLLQQWQKTIGIGAHIQWYYTPMALPLADAFDKPHLVIYDCMDELSAFKNAPPALKEKEAELFAKADIVFTGGHNLYEKKKSLHHNIHPFPSSIDKGHFSKARVAGSEPEDQSVIEGPKVGFFGVIDERLDIALLDSIAFMNPQLQFVLIGPVVKIDPSILPQRPNIHYLGGKSYEQLPEYLSGWSVALIPFAANESTQFISPTKTPEYLSGGIPVVSTSIRDVVKPYGEQELVFIGDTAEEFTTGINWALEKKNDQEWLSKVDEFLKDNSWDNTQFKMMQELNTLLPSSSIKPLTEKENIYV
jgi:hypothetical protein